MNNLFVCHSQANLLLAVSLSVGRFSSDTNDLILFQDFAMRDELKAVLQTCFSRVLFRSGTYPAIQKSWKEKIKRYPKDLKAIKVFIGKTMYDKVFEVCDDCIPEIYILKKTNRNNACVEQIWLEDGSYPYFRNTIDLSGFSSNSFTRWVRKCLLKYICAFGRFYDFRGMYMGANYLLKTVYLTFPGQQRGEYKDKIVVGISDEEFKNGLKVMYPPKSENRLDDDNCLIVMDKLDVYKDLGLVEKVVARFVSEQMKSGKKVYYKYHPREESSLQALESCEEVSKFTGVENIYSSNISASLTVVGIKSTGLQNAKKLGFKVISMAPAVNEDDENLMNFYCHIGIKIVK